MKFKQIYVAATPVEVGDLGAAQSQQGRDRSSASAPLAEQLAGNSRLRVDALKVVFDEKNALAINAAEAAALAVLKRNQLEIEADCAFRALQAALKGFVG